MKVLVTGVNGQLGYDIVKELEKRGHQAVGVDRKEMDLTSTEQIKECIENVNPEAIIQRKYNICRKSCKSSEE